MLAAIRRRYRLILLGGVALCVIALGLRLSAGPMRVDGLRPVLADRIEAHLPNTRASIGHLDLVWFGDARAIGFRFQNLIVQDRQNRVIVRAGKLETALAADSLLLMHFAPARLTAEDFFVAASVSREGRYDLGYEAHGSPGAAGPLDNFLYDLTGQETLGRPASFTRQLAVKNGEFHLRQQGTGVQWTAKINNIDFTKLRGKLNSHINLTIAGPGSDAAIRADASGEVGLKRAVITADVRNLNPARVFPSAGVTRHLALVDAPVNGRARIDYSARRGFEGAFLDLTAGKGHLTLGDEKQVFDGADIKATYASANRTVVFRTFKVQAHLLDTDLHGWVQIHPEDRKARRDLALTFDFAGPRVTGRLADDFARQTLTNAHVRGSFTPAKRQFRFDTATGSLNGAPLESQGLVYTGSDGKLGADLTAKIKGRFTKEEVFAFWPEDLSHILRTDLIERIRDGDFANADFVLKVKPGEFGNLRDDNLRLDFDFANVKLGTHDKLPDAEGLKGHAVLKGNSFAMDVTEGRMVEVHMTKGGLLVPSFHDRSTQTHIWVESEGEAVKVIEAVDPIADGELKTNGLNRDRLQGQSQVRLDITFPTLRKITDENFGLTFDATIADAGMKQAALGWDLTGGTLKVRGDLLANSLVVAGPARVGPYRGDISYRTQFVPKAQTIDFKGQFNAAQFGGSPRVPVAITGQFVVQDGKGRGKVDADIFRGDVDWTNEGSDDKSRPSQVNISGVTIASGMIAQGLPMFERLKTETPTQISLLRSGDIWSGGVEAESLSGDVAYIDGQLPRLVYQATITPDEARQLGYGALPVFSESRHLTVNVALDSESKEALIKLDDINAVLGWSEQAGSDELLRRINMKLRPQDWATLGLPKAFFTPAAPIDVTALWQQTPQKLIGQVKMLGETIDFDMPTREARAQIDYTLQVRGTVSDSILAALGYSQAPVQIKGNLGSVFTLYDTPGHPAAIANVDAAKAELGVRATDWIKPAGEAANFSVSFDEQSVDAGKRGGVNLSRIYATGDRIRIDGRASFGATGELEFADFSNLYLRNFIDVTFKNYVLPEQGINVMSISGKQLDLRPWLEKERDRATEPAEEAQAPTTAPATNQGTAKTPTHFVVDLDSLQTSADGAFTDVKLDLTWDGLSGLDGQGTAHLIGNAPVAIAFQSQGAYSLFNLRTNDFGNLLRTYGGVRNVYGGKAEMTGAYMDGQVDARIAGENIRVKQIPVLAQLLTVASMTGLNDTLTGEGIAFTDFEFPVRYRGDTLFVRNGWAKGKALGINVWGTTDIGDKTMTLNGTLIPAYRINALFGDVKSNGLGLVGIKYDVKGPAKAPQVGVDPLSVIMPGFIKVWENDQRKDPIAPLDLPETKEAVRALRNKTADLAVN
ncbi:MULTISPECIES: AsmA-like C-terminal region-containing protein [Asticcacaulis]|uniref:YhdP family protein n=1 Tax=Asticcacaulis TaxID=76890 RepID=UPI0028584FA8|nr:AsmA-like C-terminal region-containing protein [Asticcacaulis sp. BE141]MBP2158179.1 hypothetical protein [Asticcacaulis solisilvae]MDR6799224.1 hypothetical protein [Asticcacaulis sp. BE141]